MGRGPSQTYMLDRVDFIIQAPARATSPGISLRIRLRACAQVSLGWRRTSCRPLALSMKARTKALHRPVSSSIHGTKTWVRLRNGFHSLIFPWCGGRLRRRVWCHCRVGDSGPPRERPLRCRSHTGCRSWMPKYQLAAFGRGLQLAW